MKLAKVFENLLDKDSLEEEVQAFLAQHPEVLVRWIGALDVKHEVRPKVNLYSHVTDFAVGTWRETTSRWEWVLIELEHPRHRLFNKAGDPSSELTHALRQLTDWRSWVLKNLHFARTLLPDIVPFCDVAAIIGRRAGLEAEDQDRLQAFQDQMPGLVITTFDALLDVCRAIDGESK